MLQTLSALRLQQEIARVIYKLSNRLTKDIIPNGFSKYNGKFLNIFVDINDFTLNEFFALSAEFYEDKDYYTKYSEHSIIVGIIQLFLEYSYKIKEKPNQDIKEELNLILIIMFNSFKKLFNICINSEQIENAYSYINSKYQHRLDKYNNLKIVKRYPSLKLSNIKNLINKEKTC